MEEIINKVIKIDMFAKQYIKTAEDRKAELEEYVEEQKATIKHESDKKLANDLEKEKIRLNRQLETKKEQIIKKEKLELEKLDDFINKNKETLIQQMYNEILSQ